MKLLYFFNLTKKIQDKITFLFIHIISVFSVPSASGSRIFCEKKKNSFSNFTFRNCQALIIH